MTAAGAYRFCLLHKRDFLVENLSPEMTLSVVFRCSTSPSMQIPEERRKLRSWLLLPHPLQFIIQ